MPTENITKIIQFRGNKSDIELGVAPFEEGSVAFAIDSSQIGLYSGGTWNWTASGSSGGGGGWTLLSSQTLSTTGTFVIENISTQYQMLMLIVKARSSVSSVTDTLRIRFGDSNPDSGSNYAYMVRWEGQAASSQTSGGDTSIKTIIIPGATATANYFGLLQSIIDDYSITGSWKSLTINGGQSEQSGERACYGTGVWENITSPIKYILLFPEAAGASLVAGSKFKLYGM